MNSKLTVAILSISLLSFAPAKDNAEFNYPKNKDASLLITANFKKIDKEWRGTDYYYSSQTEDGILFSVLFYKLEADEVKSLVDMPAKMMNGPETSPAYALTYFATYSNTKDLETNDQKWGSPSDDFMFRQADIKVFQGKEVNQKSMYGYAMFGKDLFVNIHLSKTNCTPADSTEMRQILETIKKKK